MFQKYVARKGRLCTSNIGSTVSIPGQGTKIPQFGKTKTNFNVCQINIANLLKNIESLMLSSHSD